MRGSWGRRRRFPRPISSCSSFLRPSCRRRKLATTSSTFAFAAAGRARGGPAKVAIFASGLMGMINGTSAGNVVATGSLDDPADEEGGLSQENQQERSRPPRRPAGRSCRRSWARARSSWPRSPAFPTRISRSPRSFRRCSISSVRLLHGRFRGREAGYARHAVEDELPKFNKHGAAGLSLHSDHHPDLCVVHGLFGDPGGHAGDGRRSGRVVVHTVSDGAAASIVKAFELAGVMSIQIIAVCACAGHHRRRHFSLTGVGARFSALLLGIAGSSQLLALFFAMCIAILLGMGMPTTAAYAVAGSVVAPGLAGTVCSMAGSERRHRRFWSRISLSSTTRYCRRSRRL